MLVHMKQLEAFYLVYVVVLAYTEYHLIGLLQYDVQYLYDELYSVDPRFRLEEC